MKMVRLFLGFICVMYACVLDGAQESFENMQCYLPNISVKTVKATLDPFQLSIQTYEIPVKNEDEITMLREKILSTIGGSNITGILQGRGGVQSRVIIRDWVFGPVDEIVFPGDGNEMVSLLPGKTLLILSIDVDKIVVRASSKDGSDSTLVEIPLEDFYIRYD